MCRTPPLPTLNRWPARVRVGAGRPPFSLASKLSPKWTRAWPFLKEEGPNSSPTRSRTPPFLALAALAHVCLGGAAHHVVAAPLWSMWATYNMWVPLLDPSRTFRNLPVPCKYFRNFSDTFRNHFPYMNLILRTPPELLVTSGIPSETLNHHSFISSFNSSQNLISSER